MSEDHEKAIGKEFFRAQNHHSLLPGVWACIIAKGNIKLWEPVVNLIERDENGVTLNPNDPATTIHRRDLIE